MAFFYILGTIIFTVYGQLVIKWRINDYGSLPSGLVNKSLFLLNLFLDPFIFSGFVAAFLAALSWMAAMTKFEISFAYPFISLNFVFVLFFSTLILGEVFTIGKAIGLILIVIGLLVMVKF
jgi:uncharacterized membrane protein